MTGLSVATTTLSVLSEWGLVGFMFVFFLFKMTAMQTDVLEIAVCHILPASENDQRAFAHNLRGSFKAVFFLPFNLAFANALFLLLVFDMLEMYRSFVYSSPELVPVSCKYLQTCICFILSLTQVIGLWVNILTVLPWALGQLLIASEISRAGDVDGANKSIFMGGTAMQALLIIVVHYFGGTYIRERLVTSETKTLPIAAWVFDFSLMLGVAKFGLQGMLLGPLIVAVAAEVWHKLVQSGLPSADQSGQRTD